MNTPQPITRPDRFQALQAGREFFLGQLGDLLRETRLLSEAAVTAVVNGCAKHYDEMQNKRHTTTFEEEVRGLTSSRISLVGDDDLELGIRLDDLCNRLLEGTSVALWKTHQRYAALLARPGLPKNDNPVGPRGITEGLNAWFSAADASSLEQKLELLGRIQTALLSGLPDIYNQLDDYLRQLGVDSASAAIINTPPPLRRPAGSADDARTIRPARAAEPEIQLPASARTLLSQGALENLMFRLEQLERNRPSTTNFLTATSPKLESLLPELFSAGTAGETPPLRLNAEELGIPGSTVEGQALGLTGQFCDEIFNDPALPVALKEAVAKLQIRIAKLAIRDRSLFQRPDHPCRLLIEGIATLLLGLPDNAPATHPQCRQVTELCARLRQDPAGDLAAFADAAKEINVLIDARRQEILDAATVYLPLLEKIDRRDQADRDIDTYYASLDITHLPAVLQTFIAQDWKRLLEEAWFTDGPTGASWLARTDTLDTLLWSFLPKADAEQRRILAHKLPGVLKAVKEGIEQLALDADTQSQILDACFELQTRALRPVRSDNPNPPDDLPLVPPPAEPRIRIEGIEANGLSLQSIDLNHPPAWVPRLADLPVGHWLELLLDEVPHAFCLCRQSADSGRCLFFNPETRLALAVHPVLLTEQLDSGGARQLEPPMLFDRILARISSR